MPQLTVYIDEKTLHKIETAASVEHSSISKWVKKRLEMALHSSWPEGYFNLFGSLKGLGLKRPAKLSFSKDSKRETL
ncbi:MAG: toxin-antitoxin system, antitoxin component [Deltaproteobacteria bacterium]|nr:toxin-antitoxin system, antitoxin component [Deltaproteobacteria bacterium]